MLGKFQPLCKIEGQTTGELPVAHLAAAGSGTACAESRSEAAAKALSSPCRQVRRWAGPDPPTPPANSGEQAPPTLPASYPRTLCLTEMHVVIDKLVRSSISPPPHTHLNVHMQTDAN